MYNFFCFSNILLFTFIHLIIHALFKSYMFLIIELLLHIFVSVQDYRFILNIYKNICLIIYNIWFIYYILIGGFITIKNWSKKYLFLLINSFFNSSFNCIIFFIYFIYIISEIYIFLIISNFSLINVLFSFLILDNNINMSLFFCFINTFLFL